MALSALLGLVSTGLGIFGASQSSKAAKQAAQIQAQATDRAITEQRKMYDEAQGYLAPYREVGTGATNQLSSFMGLDGSAPMSPEAFKNFEQSPDYQFPFEQGIKAIEYSRAARSQLLNPGTTEAVQKFGSGLASGYLGNYLQRLLGMSQMGASAASAGASAAVGQGQSVANLSLQRGQAEASGVVGSANAINQGIGSTFNNLALYSLLNRGNPSGYQQPKSGYLPAQPSAFTGVGAVPY